MELQHDLVGYDNLVSSGREFVREGCLQKLSRKGYQQRMFFLVGIFRKYISLYFAYFSFLTCCSTLTAPRGLASSLEFTASSVWQTCRWLIRDNTAFGVWWPLFINKVVDSEPRMGAEFCFNIYDGKRALMVAAASSTEKSQWMEDIGETVQVRGTKLLSLENILFLLWQGPNKCLINICIIHTMYIDTQYTCRGVRHHCRSYFSW